MVRRITLELLLLVIFCSVESIAQVSEQVFVLNKKKITCKGHIQKNLMTFGDSEYIGSEFSIKSNTDEFFYGALDLCTIKKNEDLLIVTKKDYIPYISIDNEFVWISLYRDIYFYEQQKLLKKRVYNEKLRTIDKCNIDKLVAKFENKYVHKRGKIRDSDLFIDIKELFLIALNSTKFSHYLLSFETFLMLDGEHLETLNEYKKLYHDFLNDSQN